MAKVPVPLRILGSVVDFFRSFVFGPSGFWIMAPLRCAAKFDPFLSLDCTTTPSTLAQSKERKGSNFAIWQPCGGIIRSKLSVSSFPALHLSILVIFASSQSRLAMIVEVVVVAVVCGGREQAYLAR